MNTSNSQKQLAVLHSIPIWLEQTMTWLYTQVDFLPEEIISHVACDETTNLEQFFVPNIYPLIAKEPEWQRFVAKVLRRLKLRTQQHHLDAVIRNKDIRLLHSHFGNIGWENMAAAQNIPHVVTFYGRDVNHLPQTDPRWRTRYHDLFAHVDRILCEGTHMAEQVAALGCHPDKIRVHHLGVDIDQIAFRPRIWEPGQPLRVLLAASFREKKGLPYGLEALGRLHHEISMDITLIGDATDSPGSQQEKQKILDIIKKYEVDVRLLGFQPYSNLMQEALTHHIFLSPSVTASDGDTEGGAPVSLLDMSASGMLIVSTTHCDIPQIVLNERSGLLAAERDVDGLVERIHWLAAHPERWPDMLRTGREHIEAEYNAKIQGQRLARHYREIIRG